MAYSNQKSNPLYYGFILVLLCVMPFLYMADASAFAKCSSPGICEFLDIPGNHEFPDLEDGVAVRKNLPSLPLGWRNPNHLFPKRSDPAIHHARHPSIPRYKDLMRDLFSSLYRNHIWFWKRIFPDSRSCRFDSKNRLFSSFNQPILGASIIIS
ncbi:MAG: hypothetical protein AB1847_20910 [bacterium]